MDDASARLMAEKGIWLSTQPFLDDEVATPRMGPAEQDKMRQVNGTDNVYAWRRNTRSRPRSAPTFCSPQRWPRGKAPARQTHPLVYAGRSADNGNVDKCRIARACPACAIPILASSAWWKKARWPTCCWSRQSTGEHQARRGSGKELLGHHERRKDLQEPSAAVRIAAANNAAAERHDASHSQKRDDRECVSFPAGRRGGAGAADRYLRAAVLQVGAHAGRAAAGRRGQAIQ